MNKRYTKLEGAIITGTNLNRYGKTRSWNNVQSTGIVRKNSKDQTMIEVINHLLKTSNKLRWLNLNTFTGTVSMLYVAHNTTINHKQVWRNGHKITDRQKVVNPSKRKIGYRTLIKQYFNVSENELNDMSDNDIKQFGQEIIKTLNQ